MWIIGAIIGVAVVFGIMVLAYASKKNKKGTARETNYKAFYYMGALFLPIGFIFLILSFTTDFSLTTAIPFIAIGATYLGIGLANKDKWKKK